MSKVTIHIVDRIGTHSGMHYYNDALVNALQTAGVRGDVFSNYSSNNTYQIFRNFYSEKKLVRFFVSMFRLLRIVNKSDWYIVYTYGMTLLDVIIFFVVRMRSRNIILLVHELEDLTKRGSNSSFATSLVLHRCERIIVHSKEVEFAVKAHSNGKVLFTPIFQYGLSRDIVIDNIPPNIVGSIAKDRLNILFFGNMREMKGFRLIAEAVASRPCNEDLTWVNFIVAGHDSESQLQKYFDPLTDAQKQAFTIFDQYIDDESMKYLFTNCDVVILPYLKIFQSANLHVAKHYGRRVLATNLSYFSDAQTNDYAKLSLFDQNDRNSMFAELQKMSKLSQSEPEPNSSLSPLPEAFKDFFAPENLLA